MFNYSKAVIGIIATAATILPAVTILSLISTVEAKETLAFSQSINTGSNHSLTNKLPYQIAQSSVGKFRLQTGTALHETGKNFDFGVLPNGDVVAIKKSQTGSNSTEVHILDARSNYKRFKLQTGTALHETGSNFDFGVLPNRDVVAIKKSRTDSGSTEVHIIITRN